MDHAEIREILESLIDATERAPIGPLGSAALDVQTLMSFLAGLTAGDALPGQELEEWQVRVDRVVEKRSEDLAALRAVVAVGDDEARRQSESASRARHHLGQMLRRIDIGREVELRNEAARVTRRTKANATAEAYFHVGLIDFEELNSWRERFVDATQDEPVGGITQFAEISPPQRAQAPDGMAVAHLEENTRPGRYGQTPIVTEERLTEVLILGLDADPWQLQSIEFFEDGVAVNLWQRPDEDGRAVPTGRPRVALDDNHGTIYTAAGTSGGSSGIRRRWRAHFGPAVPPGITELVVTVESHQFKISMS